MVTTNQCDDHLPTCAFVIGLATILTVVHDATTLSQIKKFELHNEQYMGLLCSALISIPAWQSIVVTRWEWFSQQGIGPVVTIYQGPDVYYKKAFKALFCNNQPRHAAGYFLIFITNKLIYPKCA